MRPACSQLPLQSRRTGLTVGVAVIVVGTWAAAPAAVQAQDEAVVSALAAVLMAEDRRAFDERLLGDAARHPDPLVRRHAALAIGRLRNPSGTPILLDLLADPDRAIQAEAAFALGLLGDPLALDRLRELALAQDENGPVQVEAVAAIVRLGGPEATAALEELLLRWVGPIAAGDDPPEHIRRALKEAWRLGRGAPIRLLKQLAQSPAREVRGWAIYSLVRIGTPEAADLLMAALDDREAWIRSRAARALTAPYADSARLDRPAVARRLSDRVSDSDPHVRSNALRSLATYQDPAFAATAMDAVSDGDPNVRVQALATLGRLGGPDAAAALRQRVDRGPFAERREALLGMTRVARDAALRESAAWITDQDWQRRATGAEALALIGGDTSIAWVEGLTRDDDGRVAAAGYTALRTLDSVRAQYASRELIRHVDPVVRTLAADAIRMAPTRADIDLLVDAYRESLHDPISDARVAIVRALATAADLGYSERITVEDQFLSRYSTPVDPLVRRAAVEVFPAAAALWGEEYPVETGREVGDYRDLARRLVLPAERDGRRPRLVIATERGDIEVTLFAEDAPLATDALLRLADQHFFDGGIWHRVVPDFVIQAGDPRGDGWGGPGFTLRDEIGRQAYETGTVGIALSGPDSGGSQFFITLSRQPHLEGTFTVVGRVSAGLEVVRRITRGDGIRQVRR